MSSPLQTRESAPAPSASGHPLPEYTSAREAYTAWAKLPSGVNLSAERTRARGYPGLPSAAPPTACMYDLACGLVPRGLRALDAGCGPGNGLPSLLQHFQHVAGVDNHPRAIEFAAHYAPTANIIECDLSQSLRLDSVDAVFVVDVLGHVENPSGILRNLRSLLASDGTIVVCEPAAYPSQVLKLPVRRAFSRRALKAMLSAAGFHVQKWFDASKSFHGCVATWHPDDQHQALVDGATAILQGDAESALRAFEAAGRSNNRAVQYEAALATAELHLACQAGDAACQSYFKARGLDPSDPRAVAGLAQMNLAIGDAAEALTLAENALRLDPTDPASACAAAASVEQMFPDRAPELWRRALNLMPDNLGIASEYVRVSLAASDHESAIHALERVRQYGGDATLGVHIQLARALATAGRVADARLELGVANAMAPDHPEVQSLGRQLGGRDAHVSLTP